MSAFRPVLAVLAVFVFIVPTGIVTAQHQGHGTIDGMTSTVVIEDAAGDVLFAAGAKATGQQLQQSQVPLNFDHIDILKLTIGAETEKTFRIDLELKSLVNSNPFGFPFRTVSFSYGRLPWQVYMGPCNQRLENAGAKACLRYGDTARGMRPVHEFAYEKDGQTVKFTIEKAWMFNENRVPPRFGAELTNISAQAAHWYAGIPWAPPPINSDPTGGFYAHDAAPNAGKGPLPFQFTKGSNANGHLALNSEDPIRVSNGEATTIVYKVEALNHHTEPLTISLEPRGVPEAWSVRTPALLELKPQSTTVLPVILSLPFTHEHGKTFTFDVFAQSLEDKGSFATVTLGVYWTEIPQPSAHHETEDGGTFFHSAAIANERTLDQLEPYFPTYQMWMNGIEQDPDPAVKDTPVPSTFNEYIGCFFQSNIACGAPPEYVSGWFFPLSPSLLMGLDFDLSGKGRFAFEILPKVTSPTSRAEIRLMYCDPDGLSGARNCLGNQTSQWGSCPGNYQHVITSARQEQPLAANTAAKFDVELTIDPKWDLIQYKKGINIGMCVKLYTQMPQNAVFSPQAAAPEFVVKTARLRLPLIEYHDPIDQAFVNVGALNLAAKDPFEKQVNPGKTTLFRYDLKTNSKEALSVLVDVQGINKEWVTIEGPTQFLLTPETVRPLVVAVRAPDDAVAEERAELFVVVQAQHDASIITVSRLRATVVTSPEIEDEASQLAVKQEGGSPGLGLFVVALVAVGVAMVRRRSLK